MKLMSERRLLSLVLSIVSLAGGAHAATPWNTELLVNGDAETGTTAGWSVNGMEIGVPGALGAVGVPPGQSLGNWVFTGGEGSASSQTMSQTLNVLDRATEIDAGIADYSFAILVMSPQDGAIDLANGTLRFIGQGGTTLLTLSFTDTHVINRVYDWDSIGLGGDVPVGTRTIEVALKTSRTSGSS